MSKHEPLPPEFWTQPKEALTDPISLIYAEISARLKSELAEVPGAGVLEELMAERTAFLYSMIRQKESNSAQKFDNDRAYKETMQLWTVMVSDLRKAKGQMFDPEAAKLEVIQQIVGVLDAVLQDVPDNVAAQVRNGLAAALEAV